MDPAQMLPTIASLGGHVIFWKPLWFPRCQWSDIWDWRLPCSKLQRIFPVRNFDRSIIRSLTPQKAAGNALAIAGQSKLSPTPKVRVPIIPNIGPLCTLGVDNPHIGFQKKTCSPCHFVNHFWDGKW